MKKLNHYLLITIVLLAAAVSVQAGRIVDADLQVTLEQSASILSAESDLELIVVVENHGPDAAENVALDLIFDSTSGLEAFRIVSLESVDWSCGTTTLESTIDYACAAESISSGERLELEVLIAQGVVDQPTSLGVQIAVQSDTEDLASNNNGLSLLIPIGSTEADLTIDMTSEVQNVQSNELFSFELTVNNLGPDAATDVEVVLNLADGMAFIGARGDGWACELTDEGGLICRADALAASQASTLLVDVEAPSEGDVLLSNAFISSNAYDPMPDNNLAFYDLALYQGRADLAVEISSSSDFVEPGDLLSALVSVEHVAGDDATNPILTFDVPQNVSVVDVRADADWSCIENLDASSYVCSRAVLSGESNSQIEFDLEVTSQFEHETLSLYASIDSDALDEQLENNGSELALSVLLDRADLAINGTLVGEDVVLNSSATYSLRIENLGPSEVSDVVLLGTMPLGSEFLDINDSAWECSAFDVASVNETTCQMLSLDSGEIQEVELSYSFEAGLVLNDLTAVFSISSSLTDSNFENNEIRLQSQASPGQADLLVDVSSNVELAIKGQQTIYQVDVENLGPDVATDIVVQILVPVGVDLNGVAGDQWDCEVDRSEAQSSALCRLLELQIGKAPVIEARLTAADSYESDTLELTAISSGSLHDPSPDNNANSWDVRYISAISDLSIEQSVQVILNDATARYELTIKNNGPDLAEQIRVTNMLPFSARWGSFEENEWSCEPDASEGFVVVCTLDSLAAGAESTVEYDINISELIGAPDMINFLFVSSEVFDPVLNNNSLLAAVSLE